MCWLIYVNNYFFLNYISVLELTYNVSSAIRGWRLFLYGAGEGQNKPLSKFFLVLKYLQYFNTRYSRVTSDHNPICLNNDTTNARTHSERCVISPGMCVCVCVFVCFHCELRKNKITDSFCTVFNYTVCDKFLHLKYSSDYCLHS